MCCLRQTTLLFPCVAIRGQYDSSSMGPEIDIKDVLERLTFHSISLHDETGQMEDIGNYIKSVVNTDPKIRRWKAADKKLVIDVLIKKV